MSAEPMDDPRVTVESYIIRPTGYDDMVHTDKYLWCLEVTDGHEWGWAVRRHGSTWQAMNRKGEWIAESRGSGHNKFRRWNLDMALRIALENVDKQRLNGLTAAEASAAVAARLAEQEGQR